jgi:hypothetical protein
MNMDPALVEDICLGNVRFCHSKSDINNADSQRSQMAKQPTTFALHLSLPDSRIPLPPLVSTVSALLVSRPCKTLPIKSPKAPSLAVSHLAPSP